MTKEFYCFVDKFFITGLFTTGTSPYAQFWKLHKQIFQPLFINSWKLWAFTKGFAWLNKVVRSRFNFCTIPFNRSSLGLETCKFCLIRKFTLTGSRAVFLIRRSNSRCRLYSSVSGNFWSSRTISDSSFISFRYGHFRFLVASHHLLEKVDEGIPRIFASWCWGR